MARVSFGIIGDPKYTIERPTEAEVHDIAKEERDRVTLGLKEVGVNYAVNTVHENDCEVTIFHFVTDGGVRIPYYEIKVWRAHGDL